ETGHLVFGTLHADRILEIPSRLLSLLPTEDKENGRYVLSKVAKAFISQRLLRLRDGGRVAVREILLHTPAMPALIEKGKEHELPHLMRIEPGDRNDRLSERSNALARQAGAG